MNRTTTIGLQTEAEYRAALVRMRELWDRGRTSVEDAELIALATRVEQWEQPEGVLSKSSTARKRRSVLENLIEHRGLETSVFADMAGGEQHAVLVLEGR